MKTLVLLAFVVLLATPGWAQNAITPGVVTLAATFESISVTAQFTGDANANATVAVQYRVTGSGAFKNAYTPFIDRRVVIAGVPNPNVNQARGAIVGLTANTSYDVQVQATNASTGWYRWSARHYSSTNCPSRRRARKRFSPGATRSSGY